MTWTIEAALQLLSGTSNPLYNGRELDPERIAGLESCPAPLRDIIWAASMFFRSNSGDECDFLMHIEHISTENRATVLDWLMKAILKVAPPKRTLMIIWATVSNAEALGIEITPEWREMLEAGIKADEIHPGLPHHRENARGWLSSHPIE